MPMPQTGLPCRLNDGHCDKLDTVLNGMPAAEQYCEMCEKAGLDMSGYKQTLAAQKELATKLKAVFFPNRT